MWKAPETLPDLSNYDCFALDIETYDPELMSKGPGVRRGGYILGISIATSDGRSWYLPIGHPEGSLPTNKVLSWAKEQLCRSGQAKIGANILYDLDFLWHAGIHVAPPYYDVQIAEALLDENRRMYNLNSLAKDYLGEEKEYSEIDNFCKERKLKGDSRSHLYKMPAALVGKYAEIDAVLPLKIFSIQKQKLVEQNLWDLFIVESDLTEVLLHMRRRGVNIDKTKAETIVKEVNKEITNINASIKDVAGKNIGFWNAADIAEFLDVLGIKYPRTPKTNKPSIKGEWLDTIDNKHVNLIKRGRQLDKFVGTFLQSQILGSEINSKIHAEFNQTKSDNKGTVSGRLSGTNPNMQFMPARDGELGPLCRSLFVPDEGELWGRIDYSQIELRVLAHYAIGLNADDMREKYKEQPDIDFHQLTADMAGCSRSDAKNINFGLVYGMGSNKLALKLGISQEAAKNFIDAYLKNLPFLKNTSKLAVKKANDVGYVRTILQRRRRFSTWEPDDWDLSKKFFFRTEDEAILWQKEYNATADKKIGLRRAKTYSALNSVIQGSAADLMKIAMVKVCKRKDIVSILGYPLITVHDELGFSVPDTIEGKEAFFEVKRIMENAITFKVPILADAKLGANWGECK